MISHISILIPLLGAFSVFLLNIILKSVFEANEYGSFALFLLIINTLFILGAYGLEQYIVRSSRIVSNSVVFSKSSIVLAYVVILLMPLLSIFFLKLTNLIESINIYIIFIAFLIPLLMVFSTLYKLISEISLSFLVLNLWKVFLCILITLNYFFLNSFLPIELCFLISIGLSFLIPILFSGFSFVKKGDSKVSFFEQSMLFLSSFVSIISYVFFDSLDRFIIKETHALSIFGDYFFTFTFVVTPTIILVNYLVSKKVSSYKKNFSISMLKHDVLKSLFISILLSFLMVVFFAILLRFKILNIAIDYYKVLPLILLLSCFRAIYSFLSMAYSVVCSKKTLLQMGFGFSFLSILIYLTMVVGSVGYSLENSLAIFIFLWFLRSLFYLKSIISDLKNK